jgi:hypothetical protein
MITYTIKGFNKESESILKECGGRVFGVVGDLTLVDVPPGRGFRYFHKEAGLLKTFTEDNYFELLEFERDEKGDPVRP